MIMQNKHCRPYYILLLLFFISACEEQQIENQLSDSVVLSDAIIGEDNREWARYHSVRNTRLGRSVGQIKASKEEGVTTNCTGTILSNEFVLTAAHCVIDAKTNRPYHNIYFTPQKYYKNHMPYGRFAATKVYLPQDFLRSTRNTFEAAKYDMALVKFAKNVKGENLTEKSGGRIGFWGVSQLPGDKVTTIGYPGDRKNSGAYVEDDCELFELNEFMYDTTCDSYAGQSGAAFAMYSPKYKKSHVHGVLASENAEYNENYVARITYTRQRIISALAAENDVHKALNEEEKWLEFPAYISKGVNILVENDCSNEALSIYAAFMYRDRNGEQIQGLERILPGRTVNLGLAAEKSYKIGIKNIRGDKVHFTSKSVAATYNNSKVGLIDFYHYQTNSSGDTLHVIKNCD